MISTEAETRPSCSCVLKHPFFWSPERQLLFFQVRLHQRKSVFVCVNRCGKAFIHACLFAGCERPHREGTSRESHRSHAGERRKSCGSHQLEDAHLCPPTDRYTHTHTQRTTRACTLVLAVFLPDLRRFRTYKGNSVRDLLRAMRNKVRKHLHTDY